MKKNELNSDDLSAIPGTSIEKAAKTTMVLVPNHQLESVFGLSMNAGTKLAQKYQDFKIDSFVDLQKAIIVEGELADWLKEIDTIRVEVKAPYLLATRSIDGKPKPVIDMVKKLLDRIKNNRIIFQQTNRAALETEMRKIEEKIIAEQAENSSGKSYVQRIVGLMIAKLVGGGYLNGKLENVSCFACRTVEDVMTLIDYVKNGVKIEKTLIYADLYRTFENYWVDMATIFARHIEVEDDDEYLKELKLVLDEEYSNLSNKMDDLVVSKYREELSMYRVNLVKVNKGTRKTLSYELVDIELVPREFLQINDEKVKEWLKDNEEEVRTGTRGIPGIKFGISESAVTK